MYRFTMDGKAYPGLCIVDLKRSFQVLDGENAGRVMTGEMVRDIIGTYYNYTMTVVASASNPAEYDEFYEAISAPADSHTITVLYGRAGTMTYDAYVTGGEDGVYEADGVTRWDRIDVNFIAMKPQRRPA